MGWSCRAEAYKVMERWSEKCSMQTKSSNTFWARDRFGTPTQFFFEASRVEHDDGAITGKVWRMCPNSTRITRSMSFRINGDGSVAHGPKMLRSCAEEIESEALEAEQTSNYYHDVCGSLHRR